MTPPQGSSRRTRRSRATTSTWCSTSTTLAGRRTSYQRRRLARREPGRHRRRGQPGRPAGAFIGALPDLYAAEQDVVAENDLVLVRLVVTATVRGNLLGCRRRQADPVDRLLRLPGHQRQDQRRVPGRRHRDDHDPDRCLQPAVAPDISPAADAGPVIGSSGPYRGPRLARLVRLPSKQFASQPAEPVSRENRPGSVCARPARRPGLGPPRCRGAARSLAPVRTGTPSSATACSRDPAGAFSRARRNRRAASNRCTAGQRLEPSPTNP